ncbi:hypothetical protein AAFF_G00038470 [Aldrovandia affinis]|uniref:Collagenase 3 n=1 Tax=Aldrovandia affinis TaxID=143900 RepID=A0AAD7WZE5_9TELE|nr:hypothetical protein AAFF_G00038470 [Aldrovandia affinis]
MEMSSFLFLLAVPYSFALPLIAEETDKMGNWQFAEKYLSSFYGLPVGVQGTGELQNNVRQKLREMQAFFGLNVTGDLDSSTLSLMDMPRCADPDIGQQHHLKWKKTLLTFRIVNYTPDLPEFTVDLTITKALKAWSHVTPLVFKKVEGGTADIMISFNSRDHGDGSPFDGPKHLLAHAFPPGNHIGGDVHFDEDENWSTDSTDFNLFLVACHEFGHALGLSHSTDPGALMYPFYSYAQGFPLSEDDIRSIQALYGIKMWALDGYSLVDGYPKYIHKLGLPKSVRKIDAAVHIPDTGKTLLFTGQAYWSYDESRGRMDSSSPRSIEDDFPGIGDKVDAVYYEHG